MLLSLVPAASREQELREWSDDDEAVAQGLASSHYHSGSETSGRSSSVSRRVVRRSSEPPVTAAGGAPGATLSRQGQCASLPAGRLVVTTGALVPIV